MTISNDDIWTLEERFWLDGEPAYREHMIDGAVMLFPEPAGMMQGEAILASLAEAPRWSRVKITDRRLVRANDSMILVAYRAEASRDKHGYIALCASSYADVEGEWKIVHHQQTPVSEP